MTDAEFRAYVATARQLAAENLAALDAIDVNQFSEADRIELAGQRRDLVDLLESLADEAIAAELEATEHAGRDLTPDEVAAIRRRQ